MVWPFGGGFGAVMVVEVLGVEIKDSREDWLVAEGGFRAWKVVRPAARSWLVAFMEPSVDSKMSISAAVDTEGWRDARSAIFVSVSSFSSPSSETYSAVEHPSASLLVVPGFAEEPLLSLCNLGSKKEESSDFLNFFFTGGISLL